MQAQVRGNAGRARAAQVEEQTEAALAMQTLARAGGAGG